MVHQVTLEEFAEQIKHMVLHTPTITGGPKSRVILEPRVNLENALINVACGTVRIGAGTFCGHNVTILTGSHSLDGTRVRPAVGGRDIVIGRQVWLASNCTILGPCTIGDRCVVAAGAVVTPRSVLQEGWMYAGVTAVKKRPAIDIRANCGIGPLLLMDLRNSGA
jgi:acetyltransferase-like isoleucine patch superfamily enzyme